MSHPSIPPRKWQRSSRPHQVTLGPDDDDIDDDTPSEPNAIDDDGKTFGVELRTVRVDEMFQAFSNLGQLISRHFGSNLAIQRNKFDVRTRVGRLRDPTTGPLRITGKWALDVYTSSLPI